jgi:hypothetical protein
VAAGIARHLPRVEEALNRGQKKGGSFNPKGTAKRPIDPNGHRQDSTDHPRGNNEVT